MYSIDPVFALPGIIIAFGIVAFLIWIMTKLEPSKSREYANLLSDMYVIGTIKQLAEKDKINLVKELNEYNRINKKSDLRTKGLADVIEEELKEKVADVQEKNLQK